MLQLLSLLTPVDVSLSSHAESASDPKLVATKKVGYGPERD